MLLLKSRAGCSCTGSGTPGMICRALLCAGVIMLCLPMNVAGGDLDEYQWRNRLLFLVAPDAADAALGQVRHNLEDCADELLDRELLVFQLFIHGRSLIGDRPLDASEAGQLREALDVDPDARMLLLVGKDGGVKRRAPLTTDLREIFRQIDAMPMRRVEMRERGLSGGVHSPPRGCRAYR